MFINLYYYAHVIITKPEISHENMEEEYMYATDKSAIIFKVQVGCLVDSKYLFNQGSKNISIPKPNINENIHEINEIIIGNTRFERKYIQKKCDPFLYMLTEINIISSEFYLYPEFLEHGNFYYDEEDDSYAIMLFNEQDIYYYNEDSTKVFNIYNNVSTYKIIEQRIINTQNKIRVITLYIVIPATCIILLKYFIRLNLLERYINSIKTP